MSIAHIAWAFQQDLPSPEKFVLVALSNRCNPDTLECWPSIARVAADCGMGESTARRHVEALVERGAISRRRIRRDDGTFGVYVFHFPALGSSAGTTAQIERAETKERTPETDHPSGGTENGRPTLTQALVAYYCDQLSAQAPARARGRVGKEVKALLEEGYGLDVLRPALDRMAQRGLDPSMLPTLVAEQLPRAGRAEALRDIYDRLEGT